MHKIFKYSFELVEKFKITMPRGAKILSFQSQNGQLCIWALIDPEETVFVEETFSIVGTGHYAPMPEESEYIGTTQVPPFVWHLFRKRRTENA